MRTKISLRRLLVLPFFIQVCTVAGVIGYFSYTSGQNAISNLAQQLMQQTAHRVNDHVNSYVHTLSRVSKLNTLAAELGNLNIEDITQLEQQFLREIQTFDEVSSLRFTSTTGPSIRVKRDQDGDFAAPGSIILTQQNQGQSQYFAIENQQRGSLLASLTKKNPQDSAWYQQAIQQPANTQTWAAIDPEDECEAPNLQMASPITREGKLVGVFTSTILLSRLNSFLSDLQFSPNGHIFIIERSGNLVASSTLEQPFGESADGKTLVRLAAIKSTDWLTRITTQNLLAHTPDLKTIETTEYFQFVAHPPTTDLATLPRQRYFTKVVPYRDQYGLDWLIVLSVPETDFMGEIYQNIQKTGLWLGVALLGTIILGAYTAQWVTRPITRLRNIAQSISQESCCLTFPQTPIIEIQHLSDVFSQMDRRLYESFHAMADLNQELSESEARLQNFLECLPIGVAIHAVDGQVIYMNSIGKQYLQKEVPKQADFEQQTEYYQVYITGPDIPYPPEKLPAAKALVGESAQAEDLEIRINQQSIILEVQAQPIFSKPGDITHAIVTFQDITSRKRAEELFANYNRELQQQVKERTKALEKANLQLEQLAQTDALTKIPNRRQFEQRLQQEWRRMQRAQKPLSLLMIDIDYFKRYNDYYGHQKGDICLFKVAQTLQKAVYRASDLVARYGGEEFVVILPETDEAGAINLAKRIQAHIVSLSVPHQASEVSHIVTLSIGINSQIPSDNSSPNHLIAEADQALYTAKNKGRNGYAVKSFVTSSL